WPRAPGDRCAQPGWPGPWRGSQVLDGPGEPVGAALADQGPRLHQGPHTLLEEEGIGFRPLDQELLERAKCRVRALGLPPRGRDRSDLPLLPPIRRKRTSFFPYPRLVAARGIRSALRPPTPRSILSFNLDPPTCFGSQKRGLAPTTIGTEFAMNDATSGGGRPSRNIALLADQ